MRKQYLVSYDLRSPGRHYEPLWDELRRLGATHVLDSEWVLRSTASAYDICKHLIEFIDGNDKMIVNEVTSNCAWYNTFDITKAA